MAIIRTKALHELQPEELNKRLNELRLELAKERGQIAIGGSPTNTGRVKEVRRTIAKLLTENKRRKGEVKTD
jgi:large subunit ribosomal protein L29